MSRLKLELIRVQYGYCLFKIHHPVEEMYLITDLTESVIAMFDNLSEAASFIQDRFLLDE